MNRNQDLALAFVLAVALHGVVFALLEFLTPVARATGALEPWAGPREVEVLLPDRRPAAADPVEQPARQEAEMEEPRAIWSAPAVPEWKPARAIPGPAAFAAAPKAVTIRVEAAGARLPAEVVATGGGAAGAPAVAGGVADRQAALEKITRPKYPFAARRRGEEGRVTVAVRVNAKGVVEGVRVARGSGSRELDDAAAAAVRQADFRPAVQAGRTVDSECEVVFEFRLEEEPVR